MAQCFSGTGLLVVGSDTVVRCVLFDLQRKRSFRSPGKQNFSCRSTNNLFGSNSTNPS
jgi:hypothetical protein